VEKESTTKCASVPLLFLFYFCSLWGGFAIACPFFFITKRSITAHVTRKPALEVLRGFVSAHQPAVACYWKEMYRFIGIGSDFSSLRYLMRRGGAILCHRHDKKKKNSHHYALDCRTRGSIWRGVGTPVRMCKCGRRPSSDVDLRRTERKRKKIWSIQHSNFLFRK
jgi:hypothetical protein